MIKNADKTTVADAIGKTGSIVQTCRKEWLVTQRRSRFHDSSFQITWLRLENRGEKTKIRIHLKWANFLWMAYKKIGYLQHGREYCIADGKVLPEMTTYEFVAPPGISHFGPVPWYSNDDGDHFLEDSYRRSPMCKVRILGKTKEGRDIKCLTIQGANNRKRNGNVLIVAREHAGETAGSFVIEAIANLLLAPRGISSLLKDYTYHLIPVINPDGVANGTKNPQDGPVTSCDLGNAGQVANNPTCKVIRKEIESLKPVCFISYHDYSFGMPEVIFFEKRYGMHILEGLIEDDEDKVSMWFAKKQERAPKTWHYHCYKKFNTTAVMFELPWTGRQPEELRQEGVKTFLSVMRAHNQRD